MIRSITTAVGLALCGAAFAQGDFDFDAIPGVPAVPTVQVDLNAALLGFAASAARPSDPATADMLEQMENIRVRVYEQIEDAAAVNAFLDDASGRLERDGWQRVVFVQEDDEKVRVYARIDGAEMNGMTIMVLDADEAVFVNIAGRIDPAWVGQVAGNFGLGGILRGFTGAPSIGARAGPQEQE